MSIQLSCLYKVANIRVAQFNSQLTLLKQRTEIS